jgi:hypothetical protein
VLLRASSEEGDVHGEGQRRPRPRRQAGHGRSQVRRQVAGAGGERRATRIGAPMHADGGGIYRTSCVAGGWATQACPPRAGGGAQRCLSGRLVQATHHPNSRASVEGRISGPSEAEGRAPQCLSHLRPSAGHPRSSAFVSFPDPVPCIASHPPSLVHFRGTGADGSWWIWPGFKPGKRP